MSRADEQLLIEADSLLSLIRYRESRLSALTVSDLDDLLPRLRRRTDEIVAERRARAAAERPEDGQR